MFFNKYAPSRSSLTRPEEDFTASSLRVEALLSEYPVGAVIDPTAIAKRAKLDTVYSIAILRVLEEQGRGSFVLRVVDGNGSEIRRFHSLREITDEVSSEFGVRIQVMPENIDLGFERTASQTL